MEDSQGPVPGGDVSPAERPASPPRHRRAISVAAILLLLAAGAGAWYWFNHHLAGVTAGTPAPGPPPVTVAKPVVKNIVEWDDFIGRFEAIDDVAIRSRVTGYLDKVHFKDGAIVNKGDVLFTIDPRSFQAVFNEATARLDIAKTTVDLANQEFKRAQSLRQSGTISESVLDQRRQQYLSATAEVQAATASLEQARLNLEFTRITAPISGRIGRKLVSTGNLVNANDSILTTIVALDPIDFYFDVDERSYFAYARMALQGERPSGRDNAYEVRMVVPGDRKETRHRAHRFRRQPHRQRHRHHAGAGDLRQPGLVPPAGHVRPHQRSGLAAITKACCCPTRRSAPTRTGASSMWSTPTTRSSTKPIRPGPARRRLPRHPRGPDRRRDHRRQRPDAGQAGREGRRPRSHHPAAGGGVRHPS